MSDRFNCVVCGELCLDLPIRPIDQHLPLRDMGMVRTDAIHPSGGGIVANSGIAMVRLGLATAAFACVGNDVWGDMLAELMQDAGLDTSHLLRRELGTSTTAVLVDKEGEHTFAYHAGASQRFDQATILDHLELFKRSDFALFGYYALMPELERDLGEVLRRIRETGCRTALDAAGGGGGMQPLDQILPHLDVYVPSFAEAVSQTGLSAPREIIRAFRQHSATALLGIKLGEQGALLSPADGEWIEIEPVVPPGPIVDTTGAGDCFFAGLITGLLKGLEVRAAGRLAAAAGACSVTGIGAVAGVKDFQATQDLAANIV